MNIFSRFLSPQLTLFLACVLPSLFALQPNHAFANTATNTETKAASSTANNNTNQLYRLGVGDTIQIYVFGEDELSKQFKINQRGSINYPFLGEVSVNQLTLSDVEQRIVNGLKPDYLINPSVSVSIVEYRPFFIEGEVKKSGAYAYQPGLTVAKAVALAGGFTERASKSKIFIQRAGINKSEANQATNAQLNSAVQPGDIITVKQSFF
ncbi:polysaccharide biosynthesis/export family protein [Thalassotalea ponticola]|uniref:polysaccharide biosynthesis/export family protein n=1 Tax=Thalassotalea ponticola TaxID=1523392 RepID=UPI0025B33ACB|nr:polysaccharide biosynthesis/export family protein [Thalassotalea ponticola]MDN3652633.1 polysaccharide biosynthesis/export family protein [Thalassotalea ponticola]